VVEPCFVPRFTFVGHNPKDSIQRLPFQIFFSLASLQNQQRQDSFSLSLGSITLFFLIFSFFKALFPPFRLSTPIVIPLPPALGPVEVIFRSALSNASPSGFVYSSLRTLFPNRA